MINDAAQYLEISFTGKLSIVDHIMSRSHMLLFAPHSRSRIRLFAVPCTGDTIGLEETTNPGTNDLLRQSLRRISLVRLESSPDVKRCEAPQITISTSN